MTLGSWRYYEREVARGLENYYLAAGEEPGRWVGAGAEGLALDGEVTGEGLELLFDHGRHPVTGEVLGRGFVHFADRSTVTGFALSFSPPKSVSLLWGLGDETVTTEVREAHDAAVSTAVSFLEQHASFSRSGKGGVFQVDTTGYVAAAFAHRTSRAPADIRGEVRGSRFGERFHARVLGEQGPSSAGSSRSQAPQEPDGSCRELRFWLYVHG